MHVAAKLTLGIGAGMLVLGILVGGLGARGVGAIEEWSVEEEAVWSGSSGVHDHTDARDGVLYIFVSDEVRCDEFTLNVNVIEGDSDQKAGYTADACTEDGKLPLGYEDDPPGWLHMGAVRGLESGGSYEFVSEDYLIAVPEGVIAELIGSVIGGIFGALGGGSCACCGLLILLSRTHIGIYHEGGGPDKLQVRCGGQDCSRPFRSRGQPGIYAELWWS